MKAILAYAAISLSSGFALLRHQCFFEVSLSGKTCKEGKAVENGIEECGCFRTAMNSLAHDVRRNVVTPAKDPSFAIRCRIDKIHPVINGRKVTPLRLTIDLVVSEMAGILGPLGQTQLCEKRDLLL